MNWNHPVPFVIVGVLGVAEMFVSAMAESAHFHIIVALILCLYGRIVALDADKKDK